MVKTSPLPESTDKAPRRRSVRKQDPERTRRRFLRPRPRSSVSTALRTRVARIAAAAGVGHQLITYHFGGKQGLYEALQAQWLDRNDALIAGSTPIAQIIREYVLWVHEDEAWARTLIREALDGGFPISDERVARLIAIVENTRMRQKRGEIRDDFDVGALSLAFLAACMAPAILPHSLAPSSDSTQPPRRSASCTQIRCPGSCPHSAREGRALSVAAQRRT